MEVIEKKEYSYKEIQIKEIIENKIFKQCKFNSCILSYLKSENPAEATILRNCEFINCSATENTSQTGGIIENVLIQNLKNTGVLFLENVLFKNVVLKGKIGKISIDSKISDTTYIFDENKERHQITDQELKRYDEFLVNYYKNVECAIDISQAEFKYCEISASIPSRLIKRNPETQILVKLETILKGDWKKNNLLTSSILDLFFEKAIVENGDCILIAPSLDKKKFLDYMGLIKILRDEGIAEID